MLQIIPELSHTCHERGRRPIARQSINVQSWKVPHPMVQGGIVLKRLRNPGGKPVAIRSAVFLPREKFNFRIRKAF